MRKNKEIRKKIYQQIKARILNNARYNADFCSYKKPKDSEKFNLKYSPQTAL